VTRHIALSHVAPDALVSLRRTGGCTFKIPRWWFQRIDPRLTNRRVKTISVTVPSVTGPYVAFNATLSLQGSHRTRAAVTLSTAVNDFGVDITAAAEKYLPFEGVSLDAETTWTLGFPQDPADPTRVLTDVDFGTITDVILHMQITASTGSPTVDGPPALLAFIDLRQMDSNAWHELVSAAAHSTTITMADLVPRFLSGYHIDALVGTIALQRDGTDVSGQLAFTVPAVAKPNTVDVAAAVGQAVDWTKLARVYLIAKMKK
jgi:hypothetical protein